MHVPSDQEELRQRLERAVQDAVDTARMFVAEVLPQRVLFLIDANCPDDGNPPEGDEEVFPHDSDDGRLGPLDAETAAAWLWRGGKVPEWINVSAFDVVADSTHVRLECCGRFTGSDERVHNREEGYPPFQALGPSVPLEWESVEKDGPVLLEGRRQTTG